MKTFITLKVGYTKGIYGCSGEYFNTIIINGKEISYIPHYGLYGSEDRINHALKDKGYTEKYIPNDFGLMKQREIWKGFMSEQEALEEIKLLK